MKKQISSFICFSLICSVLLCGCNLYENMGTPSVSVNGVTYVWDVTENHTHSDTPPEGYSKVADSEVEYHFFVGGGVWVNPENSDDIYVYSDLNHGKDKYYCRFPSSKIHHSLKENSSVDSENSSALTGSVISSDTETIQQ